MKTSKGSAIIIAIIVITLMSTVVIGSSQIFLKEGSQNISYLSGVQAWYASYSGLDLLGTSNGGNVNVVIAVDTAKAGKKSATVNVVSDSNGSIISTGSFGGITKTLYR